MPAKQSLRIWLVQIGEQLPIDKGPPRLIRTALLARELVARGHDVTYWNAAFIHQQKLQRLRAGEKFVIDEGYRVALMKGRSYKKNIGPARVLSHQENARSFRSMTAGETPPDVMMCGLPSIEIADAAAGYAKANGVPIAIDCRDLWPDIIEDHLPAALRVAGGPLLAHWRRMLHRATSRATAITGVSEGFVEWGVRAARRARGPLDKPFHLSISPIPAAPEQLAAAAQYWDRTLGRTDDATVIGVYAGTLSRRFDLRTIASAAKTMPDELKSRCRIVLCGEGDVEDELRVLAAGEPHLFVPGWRSAAELQSLMRRASFGILPYPSSRDFMVTFPNKVGEYLSFGLPIMTGLDGVIGELLTSHGVKLGYKTGDVESARGRLIALTNGSADAHALRSGACNAFHAEFDPAKIFPAFADYLEELAISGSNVGGAGR